MIFRIIMISSAAGGWILLTLLAWQFRDRLRCKIDSWFPPVEEVARWQMVVEDKKNNLRETPWKDERPLILMLGDSQVEMGNWYDLFQGRFAIHNAGLSQAKIQDVAHLADEIPRIQPAVVLLFCGINDLGAGRSADVAFKDYLQLLNQVCASMTKERVVVVSIMPTTGRRLADINRDINAKVHALNAALERHCEQQGITFVDLNPTIANDGTLREDLTSDGLHLNPAGYHKLAASMQSPLTQLYGKIENK